MKNMQLLGVLAGAASMLTATSALASIDGTLTMEPGGYGNYDNAGAFNVTTTGAISSSFFTFCLERNEFISGPVATYNYKINSGAVAGGVAGQTSPGFDPLSIGTAWLYSQFRHGLLPGYNTASGANDLQWAIWYLENEVTTTTADGGAVDANAYLNDAVAALGSYGVSSVGDLFQDANGAFNVVALNLTSQSTGANRQDVLATTVPVPEPSTVIAGALLLLPFGISTVRILRKSKA